MYQSTFTYNYTSIYAYSKSIFVTAESFRALILKLFIFEMGWLRSAGFFKL